MDTPISMLVPEHLTEKGPMLENAESISTVTTTDIHSSSEPSNSKSIADLIHREAALEPWEDNLIAAAQGLGPITAAALGLDDESCDENENNSDSEDIQGPVIATPTRSKKVVSTPGSTPATRSKKAPGPPTKSVKYTPTERYWIIRMYRAYRAQQAAYVAAKAAMTKISMPRGGWSTHKDLTNAFNERFAGKYVDGCSSPRPKRGVNSLSLWTASYARAGDANMQGDLPNFWEEDKMLKPEGISLDENLQIEWNTDEYLQVQTKAPASTILSSKKRKADAPTSTNHRAKKFKTQEEYYGEDDSTSIFDSATAAINRVEVDVRRMRSWANIPIPKRRYSDPDSLRTMAVECVRDTDRALRFARPLGQLFGNDFFRTRKAAT